MPSIRYAALLGTTLVLSPMFGATPSMGEKAPDLTLSTIAGKSLRLSEVYPKAPVVLILLRGYPGYQCPFCNRQVQDFVRNRERFANAGIQVVLVYPGAAKDLNMRASEFVDGKNFPEEYDLLLDPDYRFTNLYGLRWDAPNETAYPAAFLIDTTGVVLWEKVSREHGGRTSAEEVLQMMAKVKRSQ